MEGGRTLGQSPTYLGWSIFNTICCCLPLGIAAIAYSYKAQNANLAGQTDVAESASRTAKILNIIALVCGVILLIVVIVLKVKEQQAT